MADDVPTTAPNKKKTKKTLKSTGEKKAKTDRNTEAGQNGGSSINSIQKHGAIHFPGTPDGLTVH